MTTHPAAALVEGRDPDADAYWSAIVDGQLQLRRCTACATHYALPLPRCPQCGGEPELVTSAGAGTLYTWVVVRYAFDDALAAEVPYVVGAVELGEGARVIARVEGVEIDDLEPGLPLVVTFPEGAGRPPLVFRPEEGRS
jgi:uncharacterized protein